MNLFRHDPTRELYCAVDPEMAHAMLCARSGRIEWDSDEWSLLPPTMVLTVEVAGAARRRTVAEWLATAVPGYFGTRS